jgi:DNA primase
MATQQEIEKVIDATDIVALVSEYVKLEKAGKNYKGLCPFHNEDTPSFVVNPDKKIAHCFGCGGGGSPIKFLQQVENIDFNTALSKLAQKANISIAGTKEYKKTNNYAKYYSIMKTSCDFYTKNLSVTKLGQEALEYLHKRGLNDETIKVFDIGLAPAEHSILYQVLKESNYLELDMIDLGLVGSNDRGYHDLFVNRIMFPIKNENGDVIAFSGRIFNTTDKNQAKYINTKETFIFKKGNTLFNFNNAKSEIMKKRRVILHEGQMDVIASYRSGLKEAVCSLGTALTIEQVNLLRRYTDNVVICYDSDKAGINASLKAIKLFKQNGFKVSLVMLPQGMDPDEYSLKYGANAYLKYFEENIIDENTYIFNQAFLNKNLSDISVKNEIKNQIFSMLVEINSQIVVEEFISKLAARIDVSIDALKADYSNYYNANKPTNVVENYADEYFNQNYVNDSHFDSEVVPKKIEHSISICEVRLLHYAKASKEKAMEIDSNIADYLSAFSKQGASVWITLINSYYQHYDEFIEANFISMLNEENMTYYISGLEKLRRNPVIFNDVDLEACIEKVKSLTYVKQNQRINKNIMASNDIDYQMSLLQEKFKNKKKLDKNIRRKK